MPAMQSDGESPVDAWHELCAVVEELAEKAKTSTDEVGFLGPLAEHLRQLLDASTAEVWAIESGIAPRRVSPCTDGEMAGNVYAEGDRLQAIQQVARSGISALESERQSERLPSSSRMNRLLVPIVFEKQTKHVIEIVGRGEPDEYRRRLPVVAQVCSLSDDFYRHRALSELRELRAEDADNDDFVRRIHSSLRLRSTAFTLTNEARRLLNCDRVSVAIEFGSRIKLSAVSGQDVVHRRSNVVRTLEKLISRIPRQDQVFRFEGDSSGVPVDVADTLAGYLHESNAKSLLIIRLTNRPVRENDAYERSGGSAQANGVMVVERFAGKALSESQLKRAELIAIHGGSAISNALKYEKVLPFSFGGTLAEWLWALKVDRGRKLAAAMLVVGAIIATLAFVPAEFQLQAEGTLQPRLRRNVFAMVDGIVEKIEVDHGDVVVKGQPLVTLRNTDLEFRLSGVLGEMQTTSKKLAALKTSRLEKGIATPGERSQSNDAAGGELELTAWLESLKQQHRILLRQKEDLVVKSPIGGRIVTWDVAEMLPAKPITRGESLMTIDDFDGAWNLEILMPDGRMGHLLTAQQERPDVPQAVSFILATDPVTRHEGQVREVMLSAEPDETRGNTVMIKVDIDARRIADLRPGAEVTARISCGKRSLGYVWFHELAEFVQSRILFRL